MKLDKEIKENRPELATRKGAIFHLVPEVLIVQMNEMQKKFFFVFFHFGDAVWLIHANK